MNKTRGNAFGMLTSRKQLLALLLTTLLVTLLVPAWNAASAAPVQDIRRTRTNSAATTATSTSPNCGTTRYKKPNGTYWSCTFGDDFNGTALDWSKWTIQTTAETGFINGPECYTNLPTNVSVSDGSLKLTARDEGFLFDCANLPVSPTQYSGGMITSAHKFSQTYGRFEFRAKFPDTKVQGVQSALWMWPENQVGSWPTSGEIDVAEFYSGAPDRVIPYVHYSPGTTDPNVTNTNCLVTDPSQYHTYVLEWTSQALTMKYDGKTCLVDKWLSGPLTKRPAPFNAPFFMSLTQELGIYQNAFQPGVTPLPATMTVDYVRVWK